MDRRRKGTYGERLRIEENPTLKKCDSVGSSEGTKWVGFIGSGAISFFSPSIQLKHPNSSMLDLWRSGLMETLKPNIILLRSYKISRVDHYCRHILSITTY